MKITLIHNPAAGDHLKPSAGQIQALIEEAGHKVRYQCCKEKGWHKVLKKSADLVVVAGGDGTVGKVVRDLIGEKMTVAVLPLGTANNISRTLGIADLPVTHLISSWESARNVKFDAGIAVGPWGKRYFIEGLGAGLLTSSIPEVDDNKTLDQLNETGIKVTYAQQIFREHLAECPAVEIEATLDGEDISGRYVLFEVLNMQYIGPNLFLAPEMRRDDGKFDVILVNQKHRKKLQSHIRDWQEGKQWPPEFGARRGKRLTMKWTGFDVHIDDKLWSVKRRKAPRLETIDITVERGAISFLVPKEVHKLQQLIRKSGEKGAAQERKDTSKKRPVPRTLRS